MDVILNIIGSQDVDGEKSNIEMTSVGIAETRNNKTYIRYDDSASVGVDGVISTIKIDPSDNSVTLRRSGNQNTCMYIKNGERNVCRYETSSGCIDLGIFGESICNNLKNNVGELTVSYTIDINHSLLSKNVLSLTVKPVLD